MTVPIRLSQDKVAALQMLFAALAHPHAFGYPVVPSSILIDDLSEMTGSPRIHIYCTFNGDDNRPFTFICESEDIETKHVNVELRSHRGDNALSRDIIVKGRAIKHEEEEDNFWFEIQT